MRAYNDFLIDWQMAAPERYVPLMTLPFWDLDATLLEMSRSANAGHKGIVFPARMADFDLRASMTHTGILSGLPPRTWSSPSTST